MDFGRIIVAWYRKNKRNLPWRETRNPYHVWLSEVILQQTRVQQGLSYYNSFVEKYPAIKNLAAAPETEVLKLWQGLGYYSRARNLHFAAKMIVNDYKGVFPQNYEELKKLKGVGDYTAAAIASFCYNEVQPVVDGNVYRVLSRIFGIATPIDSTEGKKEFRGLAAELILKKDPAGFNQAIMEFGAIQCVPKNPACEICPFVQYCVARKENRIAELPVKSKKTKVSERWFYYLVIRQDGITYMKQRTENDIWKGLHDFPLIESANALPEKKIFASNEWKTIFGNTTIKSTVFSEELKHILSHQRLFVRFVEIEVAKNFKPGKSWMAVKEKDLKKHAVPVPVQNYLEREF